MKSLTLASILLIAATPTASKAFDFSFVEDLLGDLGVNVDLPTAYVDLPPRAEQAIESAANRVESALDKVFGDGGVLGDFDHDFPNYEVPQFTVPDVDQIINNALGNVESRIDRALAEFDSVLASRNVDQIVEDALNKAQTEVDRVLDRADSILDDINVPDVGPIFDSAVEDLLGHADGFLDDLHSAIDGVDSSDVGSAVGDALDKALDQATGVVEEVLDNSSLLDGILSHVPTDLPPVAQQAVSSAFLSFQSAGLVTAASTAVPEPASVGLLALGLLAAAPRRR